MGRKPEEITMSGSKLNEIQTKLKNLWFTINCPKIFNGLKSALWYMLKMSTIRDRMDELKQENAQRIRRNCGNIPTLLDTQLKTPLPALVAAELSGSDTDIPPASAIRIAREGSLIEPGVGYIFFWIDFPEIQNVCMVLGSRFATHEVPGNATGCE